MQPFDYTIKAVDPGQRFLEGVNLGQSILRQRQEDEMARQQAMAQAEELARRQEVARRFWANQNPTARDILEYSTVLPPEQVKALQSNFDNLSKEAKQQELSFGAQVVSSLMSKNPTVARQILVDRAEAERNAGRNDKAAQWDAMAQAVEAGPDVALKMIAPLLGALPDGDKVLERTYGAMEQPAKLEKLQAEAKEAGSKALSAATAAKFAESKAVMDLRLSDAQIKKFAQDAEIARANVRIAAMNAQTAREGNTLKQQENQLKLQEMIDKRDDKIREKVATVEAGRASMDNMLNTIDRVLKNPALDDVVGSLEGRMPAAASALDDQESDAIALIETLGSQAFLAQIPSIKGMGALSNAEGEKLQSALQNLGRAQSEKQFRANLGEAQRLIMKARKGLAAQYGLPDTIPDTPAAEPSAAEVDALIKRYAR